MVFASPAKLKALGLVTHSGTYHPYFGIEEAPPYDPLSIMYANVTCHPPLSRPTIIPFGNKGVPFNVFVEAASSNSKYEVAVWHNAAGPDAWQETLLEENTQKQPYILKQTPSESRLRHRWFEGTLEVPSAPSQPISFTIKFRAKPTDNWIWIRDHTGKHDGQLYFQPSRLEDLSHYLPLQNPDLKYREVSSETPDTRLWHITGSARASEDDLSGYTFHEIGLPLHWTHWFALVHFWSPWIAPRHGTDSQLAEYDAILYSFLRKDGVHVVLLAISGIEDMTTMLAQKSGSFVMSCRNDREEKGTAHVLVAIGKTFEAANAAAIYQARRIVQPYSTVPAIKEQDLSESSSETSAKPTTWHTEWVDDFTYCTWNGVGQQLTETKILNALSSLRDNGIHVSNLIIDDNWQSLDRPNDTQWTRGWREFEANPEGFPSGFAAAVINIRKENPQLNQIAVWHALLGYWGGISPEGKIAQKYKTMEIEKREDRPWSGKSLVVAAEDVSRFYSDFYTFLVSCGITAVKTDAQNMLDEVISASARRSLTRTYYDTWAVQQLRHFFGRAISCMSQTPTNLFHAQLPTAAPALPTRNSDDFFPDIEASHPWHIFCNAHNSLFTQHLNVLPDWDMFQTSHPWAGFHAAARCLSGGPIYITDEPGKHDIGLIRQMTARTPQGHTVILRPSTVGKSIQAYTGYEDARLLKIGVYNGSASAGTSFVGLFNCRSAPLREVVCLAEFPGALDSGNEYVVRSHVLGVVCESMVPGDADAVALAEVPGKSWDVLSASPVTVLPLPLPVSSSSSSTSSPSPSASSSLHSNEQKARLSLKVANLGLIDKITGAAALVSSSCTLHQASPWDTFASLALSPPSSQCPPSQSSNHELIPRMHLKTTLKALGTLAISLSLSLSPANPPLSSPPPPSSSSPSSSSSLSRPPSSNPPRTPHLPIDIPNDTLILIQDTPIPVSCVTKREYSRSAHDSHGPEHAVRSDNGDGSAMVATVTVLEIDVDRAWREMELEPGWINEVGVDVFVGLRV